MFQIPIVPVGDGGGVVLGPELLASIGLKIGDVLEASVFDRQLILRPARTADRRSDLERLTDDLLHSRGSAYQRMI